MPVAIRPKSAKASWADLAEEAQGGRVLLGNMEVTNQKTGEGLGPELIQSKSI